MNSVLTRKPTTPLHAVPTVRAPGQVAPSADRSFKVLQPSHAHAQLSLFPPPALRDRKAR